MKPKTESEIYIERSTYHDKERWVLKTHDPIMSEEEVSIKRKRKARLDDIMYQKEIEAIDALHE